MKILNFNFYYFNNKDSVCSTRFFTMWIDNIQSAKCTEEHENFNGNDLNKILNNILIYIIQIKIHLTIK